jgi:transposase
VQLFSRILALGATGLRALGRGVAILGGHPPWLTMGRRAAGAMAMHGGVEGLKKPRESDRRTEALQRLKPTLRYQERQATEACFGAATPSAKRPVKAHIPPPKVPKRHGVRPGHLGVARHALDASQAARVGDLAPAVGDRCPHGDALVVDEGTERRVVCDSRPLKAERSLYRLPKRSGPRCRRTFPPWAPAVLPPSLDGQQLVALATTRHDVHGIPRGRVGDQMGWGPGNGGEVCPRVAR